MHRIGHSGNAPELVLFLLLLRHESPRMEKRNSRKKITFELKIQIIHAPAPDRSFGKRCRCVQHFIGFNETGDSGILLFLKTQRTVSTAKKKSTKRKKKTETEGINGGRVTKMAAGGGEISFFLFGGTHENKIRPAKNETKRVNYVFLE